MPEANLTDNHFRDAGFTGQARDFPRTHRQFVMLCAFNGVDPTQAPEAWKFFPNVAAKLAWERVERVFETSPTH